MNSAKTSKPGAWAVSLLVHVILLLAIVLLWNQFAPASNGVTEEVREAGIVLAKVQSKGETEYLDQSDLNSTSSESAAQADQSLQQQDEAAAMKLPDIALPGPADGIATELANSTGNAFDVSEFGGSLGEDRTRVITGQGEPAPMGKGPDGPAAQVSLFGSQNAEGHSFVFAIDRSQSMGGKGLNALKAAEDQLHLVLADLRENHSFQILPYNFRPEYFKPRGMAKAIPENINRVSEFFSGIIALGGTDHETAVRSALRHKSDVLFLLTDGDEPGLNRVQLDQIRKIASGRTTIHCIQFGFGELQDDSNWMMKLASENRGTFVYINMRKR